MTLIGKCGSKTNETFIKVSIGVNIMSSKNKWIKDAEILLQKQALSSTEIAYKLKSKYRYSPHARKVTLVLRGQREKFIEMHKVSVASSLSRDSHQVSLWGLRGYTYNDHYPYLNSDGANHE